MKSATLSLTCENSFFTQPVYIKARTNAELIKTAANAVRRYAARYGVSPLSISYDVSVA